jgi:hypothetical protein
MYHKTRGYPMISISQKKMGFITKMSLSILSIYTIFFVAYRVTTYYNILNEKERLTLELKKTKAEGESLKAQIENSKKKLANLEKSYMTKEEIETKVKDIFQRMSLFDYQLTYLDSKKMCIDRHILVVGVSAQSKDGLKAAEGILSYIGEIKKSDSSDKIYFVDYITKAKEVK